MQEKSISERISTIWPKLNRNQRRFVVAMQECATKKEGAELIGIEPDTVYRWPSIVDEALKALSDDIETAVRDILYSAAAKAAMVKTAGLDSDDEKLRQAVATEIIERAIGKVPQRNENREITWEDEVIDALRKGELTPERARVLYADVPDLLADFFRKAGVDAAS